MNFASLSPFDLEISIVMGLLLSRVLIFANIYRIVSMLLAQCDRRVLLFPCQHCVALNQKLLYGHSLSALMLLDVQNPAHHVILSFHSPVNLPYGISVHPSRSAPQM